LRLTSRQHELVRRVRRAARGAEPGVVVLDGEHLLTEALDAGIHVTAVLHDGRAAGLAARAEAAGARVHPASAGVLEAASPVQTSSGMVALAEWEPATLESVMTPAPALVLGLSDVQDPGNLGSAIRAADAFGATGVVSIGKAASPAGWRALRGSMGSVFHLPVGRASLADALAAARQHGLRIVATVLTGGTAPERLDLAAPTLLLLGSEGAGLGAAAIEAAGARLTIPMRPRVDSLNVAVASAVILHEARRQRADAA
jgi:TrmH family RNA methyltransferase